MKKITIVCTSLFLCFLISTGNLLAQKTKGKKGSMVTFMDSVSYAIGLDIVKNMKESNVTLSPDMISAAMKESGTGKEKLNDEQIMSLLNRFQEFMRSNAEEAKKKASSENLAKGEKWLEENKSKSGVMTTASGLQYKVLTPGSGEKPGPNDQVKVHYEGKLIDGSVFDSSYKRGEPISFPLKNVILGWQEGCQLMNTGAKYEFYIPAKLGYGETGAGGSIPPNAVLIFTVELLEVIH